MIEVRTLNFTLRLVENPNPLLSGRGKYYIELSGESPFNVHKSFTEIFCLTADNIPFYTVDETARFVSETATFCQQQLDKYPKLTLTGLQELADIWAKFSLAYEEYLQQHMQPALLAQ